MSEAATNPPKLDLENTLYMDLKYGRVVIEMFPDIAPKHVERIKTLAREGFYDGTPFHRVIEGFMAQGGDPTGTGTGGSKLPNLPAEFTTKRHFLRGTCGMARSADPNSAYSQFFIMFAPAPHLDGQYTIWGQVV
ncbi:MAG TPA: peptidylprolyl isomerase, partial [Acetobacteraceae bacterium]|nr:peptidylprolyl isomerase [Acetobacteraceae bacterium]